VPQGLPVPALPAFDRGGALLPGALAIALMVFLETVAVARSVRSRTEPQIDNGQELVAVGAASVAGAFFQTLPAAGGFSQTAVNQQSGARTQLSGLTTALLAVLVALFLAPVLDDLPEATLGALVVIATLGLVSIGDFARFRRIDRFDLVVALVTTAVGLVAGLVVAVGFGVVLTLLLVLWELNKAGVHDIGAAGAPPGLLALRVGAPLYTANVRTAQSSVLRRVDAAAAAGQSVDVVVLDTTAMGLVSVTVLDGLNELDTELADRGVELWVAALPDAARAIAGRTHWWPEWEAAGRVHATVEAAVEHYRVTRTAQPADEGAADREA
jgi:sulfate permease, SulP family